MEYAAERGDWGARHVRRGQSGGKLPHSKLAYDRQSGRGHVLFQRERGGGTDGNALGGDLLQGFIQAAIERNAYANVEAAADEGESQRLAGLRGDLNAQPAIGNSLVSKPLLRYPL
jgi:hypothetical protein